MGRGRIVPSFFGPHSEGGTNEEEVQALIDASVEAHVENPTDAHDAEAISFDSAALTFSAGDDVKEVVSDIDAAVAGLTGGLLGVTAYNPGVQGGASTTSTTLVDADATNLAVTFTVPASGKVLFRASMWGQGNASWDLQMGIRESTSVIAGPANITRGTSLARRTYTTVVSGLTPGQSKTWKLGIASSDGTSVTVNYGGDKGAGVLEVWAAP